MALTNALTCTVTSPLNVKVLSEASVTAGSAAYAAEQRKHIANDLKCNALGWVCIPLAVQHYGCWGLEAKQTQSLRLQCSFSAKFYICGISYSRITLLSFTYALLLYISADCLNTSLLLNQWYMCTWTIVC